MSRPIAYDLTRLCYAPPTPTPRGIDRVEIALATYFCESWPGNCVVTLPTPWGIRCLDREFGLKVVELVRSYWKENVAAEDDPAFRFAKQALESNSRDLRSNRTRSGHSCTGVAVGRRIWRLVEALGLPIGRRAVAHVPKDAIYFNVGHVGLAIAGLLRWLQRRPDIKPVFMIHDTIPLDYPEFVSSASSGFHARMVANTARYARGLVVTTEAAHGSISAALDRKEHENLRVFASPLAVDPQFLAPLEDPIFPSADYFIYCGAIEPRKNLLLLLTAWREIVARLGDAAPTLLVLGARGGGACETMAMLDRCVSIKRHVIEVEGLSTSGLRHLMSGAKALLMPSFAEGFGLPIIEALALGTPVIASDIPAHREAGGNGATYVDATDGPAWAKAILAHNSRRRDTSLRPDRGHIVSWPAYCAKLEKFIQTM